MTLLRTPSSPGVRNKGCATGNPSPNGQIHRSRPRTATTSCHLWPEPGAVRLYELPATSRQPELGATGNWELIAQSCNQFVWTLSNGGLGGFSPEPCGR